VIRQEEEQRRGEERTRGIERVVWAAVVQAEGGGVDVEARPRRWTDGARDPEKAVVMAVAYAEVSREVVRSRIDGVARRRADRRGRDETAGTPPPTLVGDGQQNATAKQLARVALERAPRPRTSSRDRTPEAAFAFTTNPHDEDLRARPRAS
jgi:hypothetical protein